jgi:predicted ATP-dependent serine protease
MVYHTQTIQELISQSHDVEWLVDGVLPRDGVLLITGEAGIGKTWMVLALAMALDGGKPWLDEFSTIATKVLMIDEESSPSLLKDRFQKLKAQTSGTLMLVGAGVMLDDNQRIRRARRSDGTGAARCSRHGFSRSLPRGR